MKMFSIQKSDDQIVEVLTGKKLIEQKILPILPTCIGRNNAISQKVLVQRCFGFGFKPLQQMLIRNILHVALHQLRSDDEYQVFIMGTWDEDSGEYMYYIPTSQEDADEYRSRGEKRIAGIRAMINRCQKAVDQEWWKRLRF